MADPQDLKSLLGDLSSGVAPSRPTPAPGGGAARREAAPEAAEGPAITYPEIEELLRGGKLEEKAQALAHGARTLETAASRYAGADRERVVRAARAFSRAGEVLAGYGAARGGGS